MRLFLNTLNRTHNEQYRKGTSYDYLYTTHPQPAERIMVAVLQTYGLNTALRKMGVDAKVLDYNPKYYYTSTQPLPIRMVRAVVRFPDLTQGTQSVR